jgi:hypothetical protein
LDMIEPINRRSFNKKIGDLKARSFFYFNLKLTNFFS